MPTIITVDSVATSTPTQHQSDIVGDQRHVHGAHQGLVHGVIETQKQRCQASGLDLMGEIGRAEYAGGESTNVVRTSRNI